MRCVFRAPEKRSCIGYRTVEGGADDDEVYNCNWLHYPVLVPELRFQEEWHAIVEQDV